VKLTVSAFSLGAVRVKVRTTGEFDPSPTLAAEAVTVTVGLLGGGFWGGGFCGGGFALVSRLPLMVSVPAPPSRVFVPTRSSRVSLPASP
jgi:hypothetical protein